ncbi:MAG: hypothetical protein MMC23_008213 [Stictis urceolatum]|nr:hypothetical protein [Stictis urceolata]
MSSEEDFEDDYGPPDKLYDPLSSAAKEGSLDTLRSLVLEWRTKIFPAQIKPGDWRFQLQKAANKNQVCTLSYILSQGAVITKLTSILALDADAGRSYIKSSLTTAEISTPALTPAPHGADPNAHTRREYSVLDHAAATSSPAVFSQLLQHGGDPARYNPLHTAAELRSDNPDFGAEGCLAMLEYLVCEVGVDVNSLSTWKGRAPMGRRQVNGTALHSAIQARNRGTVEWLLENGADPEVRNAWGWDAMVFARDQGSEVGVEMLERWAQRQRGVEG